MLVNGVLVALVGGSSLVDLSPLEIVAAKHLESDLALFDDAQILPELKNLGHGVGNVTRAFSALITQRPQPVVQTRKSGSSKQARKRYKLTTVGINRVEEMVKESANQF